MSARGIAVAEAARALVGTRFRLHGRGADGLDCVGVVAAALGVEGAAAPRGYALRGGDPDTVAALLDAVLARTIEPRSGDVLLMMPGAGQLHLGVRTAAGFVHADASLRRVVERPGVPPWPVIGCWHVREG